MVQEQSSPTLESISTSPQSVSTDITSCLLNGSASLQSLSNSLMVSNQETSVIISEEQKSNQNGDANDLIKSDVISSQDSTSSVQSTNGGVEQQTVSLYN